MFFIHRDRSHASKLVLDISTPALALLVKKKIPNNADLTHRRHSLGHETKILQPRNRNMPADRRRSPRHNRKIPINPQKLNNDQS